MQIPGYHPWRLWFSRSECGPRTSQVWGVRVRKRAQRPSGAGVLPCRGAVSLLPCPYFWCLSRLRLRVSVHTSLSWGADCEQDRRDPSLQAPGPVVSTAGGWWVKLLQACFFVRFSVFCMCVLCHLFSQKPRVSPLLSVFSQHPL